MLTDSAYSIRRVNSDDLEAHARTFIGNKMRAVETISLR
jgi:hypothetical protein